MEKQLKGQVNAIEFKSFRVRPCSKKKHLEQNKSQNPETNSESQVKSSTNSQNYRKKMPQSMKAFLRERKNNLKRGVNQRRNKNKQIKPTQALQNSSQAQILTLPDQINNPKEETNQEKKVSLYRKVTNALAIKNTKKVQPKIKCSICLSETNLSQMIKAFKCRHLYCKECLQSYVTYKINMFQEVYCPDTNDCQGILQTEEQFFKNLSKKQRRSYKKINNFYLTQTDSSNKLCPSLNCDGVIKVDDSKDSQKCQLCKTQFCSKCFLPIHQGQCKKYQVKFMQDNLHFRQCAKCKIVVERIQGCNHMTCKCKYQFCYMCGGKWASGHLCKNNLIAADDQDGCEWGESVWDHIFFLAKIPLKIILTILYTALWVALSFTAAPYNIFFFIYWLMLIVVVAPFNWICDDDERTPCTKLLFFLIFPLIMIYCIPNGIMLFLERFEEECPFLQVGYTWIIRI